MSQPERGWLLRWGCARGEPGVPSASCSHQCPCGMCQGSRHCLGQDGERGAGTHGCHFERAALLVLVAGAGPYWNRRVPSEEGDGGRWLCPCPGAVLAVASALPGTTSAVPGQMEAAAQPVPCRRAMLASHPLQLLKVSEQLLIVPGAANEIIAAWRWEPLPGPAACRPPPLGTGGCSAPLAHALDPISSGKPLGNPNTASVPFTPHPLPTLQSAHGLQQPAPWLGIGTAQRGKGPRPAPRAEAGWLWGTAVR